MTWKERAARIIAEATSGLPPDTSIKQRAEVIRKAYPLSWVGASWPRKAWQAARREHLSRYQALPAAPVAALPLFNGWTRDPDTGRPIIPAGHYGAAKGRIDPAANPMPPRGEQGGEV